MSVWLSRVHLTWKNHLHIPSAFNSTTNLLRFRAIPFVARQHNVRPAPSNSSRPLKERWTAARSPGYVLILSGVCFIIVYKLKNVYYDNDTTFSPSSFRPYKIKSKIPVSSTSSLFVLQDDDASSSIPPCGQLEAFQKAREAGVWSIDFKQPFMQIARAYTPIQLLSQSEEGSNHDGATLSFLIRREQQGEVSGYLHALEEGSVIEVRGPRVEFVIPSNVRKIVFLAGGTGIAPVIQAASLLLGRRRNGPSQTQLPLELHILWANRHREDCVGGGSKNNRRLWSTARTAPECQGLIVRQLELLKERFPGTMTVQYFVDEEGTFVDEKALMPFFQGKQFEKEDGSSNLVLIAGPDGFVEYLAGPKEWRGGRQQQGRLGGVLGRLGLNGWSVWKL